MDIEATVTNRCDLCNGVIQVMETYAYNVTEVDRAIIASSVHPYCGRLAHLLNLSDENDLVYADEFEDAVLTDYERRTGAAAESLHEAALALVAIIDTDESSERK